MTWTLCTSGAIIHKAGLNANATVVASSAIMAEFYDEAEAQLNAITGYDWTTNYASVGTYFKNILADTVSDLSAMKVINYDMSGFSSRTEAQTMLDVLRDNILRNMDALKDDDKRGKMGV